jgi:hypothetical protein
MKFSDEDSLGQVGGLLIALAFPIGYGIREYLINKKLNFFSALGLFSVIMTGGIGLLNLSREWMIAKETLIPLILGVGVLYSNYTRFPLVKVFMDQILDLKKIDEAYKEHGHPGKFDFTLRKCSFLLALSFLISAILNFVLAAWVLEGEPGTKQFNESLGKMTALSFPVITLPMLFMVGAMIYILVNDIKKSTELELERFIKQ